MIAGGLDLGSGELATDLRALRDALEEFAGAGSDRPARKDPADQPRPATSAD